jgi:transposase
MVRDAQSGKYRRTRLFVLTLGYSRKSVRLLTWRSSVRTWAELHEKAFRRLGGCPRVVVLDNLKEGVAVPDIYEGHEMIDGKIEIPNHPLGHEKRFTLQDNPG